MSEFSIILKIEIKSEDIFLRIDIRWQALITYQGWTVNQKRMYSTAEGNKHVEREIWGPCLWNSLGHFHFNDNPCWALKSMTGECQSELKMLQFIL